MSDLSNSNVSVSNLSMSDHSRGGHLLKQLEQFGEKPGLERIQFLLDALGNPERAFRAVHVGGTNGKGSTSAMVAAIMRAGGKRVGLFTSPHLARYNERIAVDGQPIADRDLDHVLQQLQGPIERAARSDVGQPTEFEVATAAAIVHFAQMDVDVAVVEVGLGGRLDSTNVVNPAVSVLTPIGLDHTNRLGTTISEIAADKAGIIRPNVPLVCAPQQEEAARVITEVAEERGAPLIVAGRDYELSLMQADQNGTMFDLRWQDEWFRQLNVPLLGPHQAVNAAVAAVVGFTQGLSEEAVRAGLEQVAWPGRFELVERAPAVVLDGAHNEDAARALATSLATVFPGVRPVFVMGVLQEKPVDRILRTLLPLGRAVVFTAPKESRTPPMEPEELVRRAEGLIEDVAVEEDAGRALARAKEWAGPDGLVCVCGSLYLVGEVRAQLAGKYSFVRE